jgi:WD40 repeat protein
MEAPTLTRTHACAPATVRGRGVLLGAHADSQLITYASGHHVVLRHVRDEIPARFYEHQYACTVARVSPNGQWVASGDVSGRVRVWGLNEDMTLKAEHHPLSGAVDDIAWSEGKFICI